MDGNQGKEASNVNAPAKYKYSVVLIVLYLITQTFIHRQKFLNNIGWCTYTYYKKVIILLVSLFLLTNFPDVVFILTTRWQPLISIPSCFMDLSFCPFIMLPIMMRSRSSCQFRKTTCHKLPLQINEVYTCIYAVLRFRHVTEKPTQDSLLLYV